MKKQQDFINGEVLVIDKPLGWTSFDVVKKIRYHLKHKLQVKKIKIGHAGTLDPLATGILVLCTGKKTKVIDGFMNEKKTYDGIIQLGATTPSFDLETEIDATFPVDINTEKVAIVAQQFLGEQLQEPPIFSAKRVKGKRAYEYARKGEKVELKKNKVIIDSITLELLEDNCLSFQVDCSKGTYIRSLARDIAKKLNTGGHLIKLRRTRSGNFALEQAISMEDCLKMIDTL
jgi:tRNA pseudouridine55 synthase